MMRIAVRVAVAASLNLTGIGACICVLSPFSLYVECVASVYAGGFWFLLFAQVRAARRSPGLLAGGRGFCRAPFGI